MIIRFLFYIVFVVSILNDLVILFFMTLIIFQTLFFTGFIKYIIPHIKRLSDEYEEELKPLIGLNSELPTDNLYPLPDA